MKQSFWNDAAQAGVVIALASIIFNAVNMYFASSFVGFLAMAVYWTLVVIFVKRRVLAFGDKGYSYGRCVGFISAMCMCAGFLEGAFSAVAANWLFAEQYDQMLVQTIAALENTRMYTGEQLQLMVDMLHSPMMLVISGMLGGAIKGGFFGLLIAAFTRREQNIFKSGDEQ